MPPVQKSPIQINFAQGLDLKTDPKQVPAGKFLGLKNTVFNNGGLLTKRNGFKDLPAISTDFQSLTTYKGNLVAVGTSLSVYNEDSGQWQAGSPVLNVQNTVVPLVRNSNGQSAVDVAIASNGLSCSVFNDSVRGYLYQISDSATGEIIVNQMALPSTATQARAFVLGNRFIITFLATVSATTHLRYIAIPLNNPTTPGAATDISAQVTSLTAGYDGYVANNNLYIAWDASDVGGAVRLRYLTSTLNLSNQIVIAGQTADLVSVTADISGNLPMIWISWYDAGSTDGTTTAYDSSLNQLLAPTVFTTGLDIYTLTSAATAQVNNIFYEINNEYNYVAVRTDYISTNTVTLAGTVGTESVVLRSVGLAGKAFYFAPTQEIYMLSTYSGAEQPTYFLISSTGEIVSKLAYANGGGLVTTQVLASANIFDNDVSYGYQFKDILLPVNKSVESDVVGGIYSLTGVNLAKFSINDTTTVSSEIGNDLQLTGGFVWMYDGAKPVEHNFHVFPEDVQATWSSTGGSMAAQPDGTTNTNAYAYQFTYEWTDAVGNIHRSAPSIPVFVTTTGTGSTGSVDFNIPTLRLTAKTGNNPVRILIYRWSVANPVFYIASVTFISNPNLNNTAVDSITSSNTVPDSQIIGNPILYTTGGIVENIAAPATSVIVPFKSRLFAIDSEDRNSLWYSKQVIESTPVEFSDLFTIFVAPTTGSQGSTGEVRTLFPMDDKLVIGKDNALYYITGNGPDNSGNNNDFSEPVFITATVGCSNQQSFVMIPQGLMFQSDKGIWILGRDLSTNYIGADVETFTTGATVKSSVAVPGTNQVRFTMSTGVTLMYDYYYNQWTTFTGIPGISSTLFQGMHTYLNDLGKVRQETPGMYQDGSNPVLIGFTTSWIKLAGLQGYQRAYYFYMLAEFLSSHKLNIQIAYDYNPNPIQSSDIIPANTTLKWGGEALWGNGEAWGSGAEGSVEQHRVFLSHQKCQAFQIVAQEFYDPSHGTPPGAGLTISGLNLVVGVKKGYPVLRASNSVG